MRFVPLGELFGRSTFEPTQPVVVDVRMDGDIDARNPRWLPTL